MFFFSSRRRHTRWTGDWSSDVCSSDLWPAPALVLVPTRELAMQVSDALVPLAKAVEIGRASCRERGETWAACVLLKKKGNRSPAQRCCGEPPTIQCRGASAGRVGDQGY